MFEIAFLKAASELDNPIWFRAWWLWHHVLREDAAWEPTILHQFEVSVSGSGADSVLCSLFGILYFRLEIYLSVSGFGFSILLVCFFFRVLHVYFRVLSVCLYYGHKSDWNGAYERRVIKVLIIVWNCIFKSSQWVGQFYFPWQFIPFCNCPWVEGIRMCNQMVTSEIRE